MEPEPRTPGNQKNRIRPKGKARSDLCVDGVGEKNRWGTGRTGEEKRSILGAQGCNGENWEGKYLHPCPTPYGRRHKREAKGATKFVLMFTTQSGTPNPGHRFQEALVEVCKINSCLDKSLFRQWHKLAGRKNPRGKRGSSHDCSRQKRRGRSQHLYKMKSEIGYA